MLLEIRDGSVSQGGVPILSHFDFFVRGTEKIAIVGRNGAGKTTLIDAILGKLPLETNEKNPESHYQKSRRFTMGFLSQSTVENPEETVEQYVLRRALLQAGEGDLYDKARYDFELRFARTFTGFGFSLTDRTKPLGAFSGGEQTKISLIGLLLEAPDLLVLDEPTNHLDLSSVQWLEEDLRNYPGAVIAVSHDRYFIDQFADVVCEVSGGKVARYAGGYTAYREEKTKLLARQKKSYEQQQEELERLNRLIVQFRNKPRKAAFARSRETLIRRMELLPKPDPDDAVIHTEEIVPARPGARWVAACKDLVFGYDKPLSTFTFRLRRGQKIGILGPNGTGKTALVRTIAGLLPPLKGELRIGEHVDLAFLDQFSAKISSDETVIDYFHNAFPALTMKEVRQILAGYLFYGDDMGKKVANLSGGEKMRLCLAKILQTRPNFLILDEPTNNMDIPAKETLESIFRQYRGTILFVSHDRYFLSRVADALLIFDPKAPGISYYPSDYAHYAARKEKVSSGLAPDLARSAENQALIETLRAVPKKETGMLRQIPEEEQAFDWRFSLLEEKLHGAEGAFLQDCEALETVPETEEAWEEALQKEEALFSQREQDRDAWTEGLLSWYDIYLEREAYRAAKAGHDLTQI
ncbi:MAG: ABC-F family ATP-binding cassette domain-containing protein [Lachnospiraceae bacterium]